MKRLNTLGVLFALFFVLPMNAQQLPDPHFENWSSKFKSDVQATEHPNLYCPVAQEMS